jgi:hypothetical protein
MNLMRINMTTREHVIECAKDWMSLVSEATKWGQYNPDLFEGTRERMDVLNACVDLAYGRTREALVAYSAMREAEVRAHERMLTVIEETLQEGVNQ